MGLGQIGPAQLGIVAAMWTVGVMIPGPNFFAAARLAATQNRRAGFAAVGGIGLGTMLWGCAGAFGLRVVFALVPWLFGALKILGAAYLLYVGARTIAGSFGPQRSATAAVALGPAFRTGLLTSVSNPKSALFVTSLFAAIMPRGAPPGAAAAVIAEMIFISLAWYGLVVCLLTTGPASRAYARSRRWLDRFAGAVFLAFGARLIAERA